MTQQQNQSWIPLLELEDAQIKWSFSHFDGRADTYNAEGDHNFTVQLPPDAVPALVEQGWAVKEYAPMDEGGDPEYTLKVNISYKFEDPQIYLIQGDNVRMARRSDLKNLKRATVQKMNIVVKPSRWVRPDREGISAYVQEMYVWMNVSRFGSEIAHLNMVHDPDED